MKLLASFNNQKMPFNLLVHFDKIADHRSALDSITEISWDALWRSATFFSNKGAGQVIDATFLDQRSHFERTEDMSSFTLRESRKRDSCVVQILFTNYARAFLWRFELRVSDFS